ncbi:hypothetical protein DICPUDRAFT_150228 [Dictyostelium purpureum]|uniref:BRO1 domain-containing protein n=1 Tax=Dictyostelium purpureum TaxID=5786 RepID=F0ZFS7_DICPU|nr:uncharacterized protein DICPUDRAFT_150228 [Dictyostelium purpureum]EGC37226.1 hypothetical protein DICPUDRAFT_150228 [Dictyostelium purpureum]|eukprot:XP_003286277.1 hypothetical protein DICPUDRAFT_150228 [Dictyostelium purpureum]
MEGTLPVFDNYCFYVHRLKTRSKLNYKAKLVEIAKELQNPFIISLGKDISDCSDKIDDYFFSTKARDLLNLDTNELIQAVEGYMGCLGGIIGSKVYIPTVSENDINNQLENVELNEEGQECNNKNKGSDIIRKNLRFSWTTVFGTDRSITSSDAIVEYASILFNLGIWYLGYSDFIVSNRSSPTEGLVETDRQVVYDFLLKGAGIFDYIRTKLRPFLSSSSSKSKQSEEKTAGSADEDGDQQQERTDTINEGSDKASTDFSDVMLKVLYLQCIGQAQELTIGRAYKKNTIQPIVKLSVEIVNMYKEAKDLLISHFSEDKLAENRVEKFVNFFMYKISLYQALALNQQAFQQNAAHKYGESIATAKKAQHQLKQTLFLIRPCVSITLPQTSLQRPTNQLSPIVDATLARLERENTIIGYEVVPSIDEVSELPQEGTRLAKSRPLNIPNVHNSWSNIDIPSVFNKDKILQESDLPSVIVK